MESSRTLIKQSAATQQLLKVESNTAPISSLSRIPASRVDGTELAVVAGAPGGAISLRGVLRGEQVLASVVPFRMVDLPLKPDFPLPGAGSLSGEALDPASAESTPEQDRVLQAEWQERLEEAVERARAESYAAGYEQGYVAAEAALQASVNQRKAELDKDIVRLQEAWAVFLKKSEPLMASLAFEIVQQLLDAPLPQDIRAASMQALSEALSQFGNNIPIEITLHPDDFARLQTYNLTDDLEALHRSIQWNPQASIPVGDWIIQSPDAAIRRLKEEMLSHLKSRLGLLAVMKSRDS